MDKKDFARFLSQKRQDAGLTQKQMAEKLYVDHSTVSKWERGLSFPDITLISKICEILSISEHEFLTACEDHQARNEKLQAKRYRGILLTIQLIFAIGYVCAIIPCFICNLAINHTLSWFWIVFSSLLFAACITNLPFILSGRTKHNLLITSLCAAAALFLMLAVIAWQTDGSDWLFSIAYPIAGLLVAAYFAIMLICRYLPVNIILKLGLSFLITAGVALIGMVLGNSPEHPIEAYVNFLSWNNPNDYANKIVFLSIVAAGIVFSIVGLIMLIRKKMQKA